MTQQLLQNEVVVEQAFRTVPLLVPPSAWRAEPDPARLIRALAREFESEAGILDVSICAGFPYADTTHSGLSLFVSSNGTPEVAVSLADRLRNMIWSNRDAFFSELVNVEIAVHEAMQATDHPVLIADAGDDPVLGAASEGTGLLWALIDLGAQNAALAAIVDPAVVDAASAAGVGSKLTFDLGGKHDRSAGYPIEVTATVRRIIDASATGQGRTVLLDVEGRHGGSVEVVVCERVAEPTPDMFARVGVNLAAKHIVAVKSSWRAYDTFRHVAARFIETTTPGLTTPEFAYFNYQRLPRPMFPLDAD